MVQCVRHSILPRLKKDAGLPFFFPLKTLPALAAFSASFFASG
ncbi:pyr operon leader peptide [Salmonella enterica subsp. enterica serovar Anatum]|nr:pyr operon leader peptide [Salmonella enterica subsp. enterica serovar Anatum]